jgi:hypothetical protein
MTTKTDLGPYQFLGALSFLTWEGNHRAKLKAKENREWTVFGMSDGGFVHEFLHSFTSLTSKSHHDDHSVKSTIVHAINHEEEDEGELGQADITCEEDGLVFSWHFQDLEYLLEHEPHLGLVMERCLSADLSKKLDGNWTVENINRYRNLLTWAVHDGVVNEKEKILLGNFMKRHNIAKAEHVAILRELGWTAEEYDNGSKCQATGEQLLDYYHLQEQLLRGKLTVSEKNRERLAEYRRRNRIDDEYHKTGLYRLGWSKDEFEVGILRCKDDQEDGRGEGVYSSGSNGGGEITLEQELDEFMNPDTFHELISQSTQSPSSLSPSSSPQSSSLSPSSPPSSSSPSPPPSRKGAPPSPLQGSVQSLGKMLGLKSRQPAASGNEQ